MKSIIVVSVITFVLIFGGVVLMSSHLNRAAFGTAVSDLDPDDFAAAERVFDDLALERDRVQVAQEELVGQRLEVAVHEQTLNQARVQLQNVIKKLDNRQQQFAEEQEASAARLAKMYEAMKPAQAAPILSTLDLDIVLEIMTRMKERQAAKILANMDAGLAARISTRMSIKGGER